MKAHLDLEGLKKSSETEQGSKLDKGAEEKKAFKTRSANQLLDDASKMKIPNMLFSEFIFEGELTTLYAATNRGKSFLALNIAQLIASGTSLDGLKNEADPQPVVFFDLELSDLQFQARYSEKYEDSEGKRRYRNQFNFHPNLFISKFSNVLPPKGVDQVDWYFNQIKETARECNSKVLFIDNISWLSTKGLEKLEDAKKLVERLLKMVKNDGYTIVLLAHTPKVNDNTPIMIRDLAGSAGLGNFCDAAFIINESWTLGKPYKYLKQNKCRSAVKVYDETNVLNVAMDQLEPNFVGFRIAPENCEYMNEGQHLKRLEIPTTKKYDESQKLKAKQIIAEALERNPEASSRELEKISGVSHNTANKYRKEMLSKQELFDGYLNPREYEDEK
tara:strand:- start:587 stop:1753 length:1167 start_codon:yes stop_codon:yes gene_type:complete